MRYKFKNGTTKDPLQKDRVTSKLLQQFDEANLRLQYRFAHWLERKTVTWSRKSWILILILFTILTSGSSVYVVIKSLSQSEVKAIRVIPITKLVNSRQADSKRDLLKGSISSSEFEKIVRFRRYLDSLLRSPTGQKIKDSVIQYRPGLLDSLTIVEKYYQSQFKK
ncbi:hypothetical protein [Flavobacterium sp. GT3P67]|uniref:hypothetical protein n=1 Tax=Flavobacterium sp. GT3P67 TaxID=2541722 RepID=UPI001053AF89|nr:hypothetical protein [Flavobacterium sp. GT3P67]TDE52682.1 hypothetical protein E0H99_11205 [Flavobacterium sp. GT3P67]